jgi:hypothetical protein
VAKLSEPFGPSWRVGDEPRIAPHCRCFTPTVFADIDGEVCVKCGREPDDADARHLVSPKLQVNGGGDPARGSADDLKCLPMTSHRHIGFVAPSSMFEELHELAASRERTVSAELRLAVRAHLAENEAPPVATEDASRDAKDIPLGDQS